MSMQIPLLKTRKLSSDTEFLHSFWAGQKTRAVKKQNKCSKVRNSKFLNMFPKFRTGLLAWITGWGIERMRRGTPCLGVHEPGECHVAVRRNQGHLGVGSLTIPIAGIQWVHTYDRLCALIRILILVGGLAGLIVSWVRTEPCSYSECNCSG